MGAGVMAGPAWLDELGFGAGPPWHAMGTRSLPDDGWPLQDDGHGAQVERKRVLLDTDHDVVAADCPGARAAVEEAARLVAASTGGVLDAARPPLEAAALLVQEDLCVLIDTGDGWRLAAGVVCFPSMWRLPDKLGLHITAVHDPVPAYAEELGRRVDRFLDRLRAGRPVWRRNWLVHDSDELHVPDPPPAHGAPLVPGDLWLRSERQTLRRLPSTGAILFTIRTEQAPIGCLATRPTLAAAMAQAVSSWSPALVTYRGAGAWREPLLAWLDEVSSGTLAR